MNPMSSDGARNHQRSKNEYSNLQHSVVSKLNASCQLENAVYSLPDHIAVKKTLLRQNAQLWNIVLN